MAGIYFHIPFCKQACHYCDFHFSTSLKHKSDLLNAMREELQQRLNELNGENIETVYFGGGTPSLLNELEINRFFDILQAHTSLNDIDEITLEANPDDLTKEKLEQLRNTPINRLSIGVQSFFEQDLKWMNRAHNAQQAKQSIVDAQEQGFENITIDLIYGSPTTTLQMWQKNLEMWLALDLPHLSAYALTVEKHTALYSNIQKGKVQKPSEEEMLNQFQFLMDFAKQNGIEHYEISNYAREGNYAKHNTSYWFGKPYLGIGPSAHSFDGKATRRMNIANNLKYMQAIEQSSVYWQVENLTLENQINEYLMTRLRTLWGIDEKSFAEQFGQRFWQELKPALEQQIGAGNIVKTNDRYTLTEQGKFVADGVVAELFF